MICLFCVFQKLCWRNRFTILNPPPALTTTMRFVIIASIISCLLPIILGFSVRGRRNQGYTLNSHRGLSQSEGNPWDYDSGNIMTQDGNQIGQDVVIDLLRKVLAQEQDKAQAKASIGNLRKRGNLWSSLRGPLPLDARFNNDGSTADNTDMARNLKAVRMRYGRK